MLNMNEQRQSRDDVAHKMYMGKIIELELLGEDNGRTTCSWFPVPCRPHWFVMLQHR